MRSPQAPQRQPQEGSQENDVGEESQEEDLGGKPADESQLEEEKRKLAKNRSHRGDVIEGPWRKWFSISPNHDCMVQRWTSGACTSAKRSG
jgi:hypothetical protein